MLALALQPDGLAVLDIGRQLDRHLAAVGEMRRDLGAGRGLFDRDVERGVDVGAGRRRRRPPARAAGAAKTPAPKISLKMSVLPSNGSPPGRSKNGTRSAGRAALARRAEPGERIAAGRALEALETLLAGRVDLATVEGAAVLLVADDLVGLVQRGKTVLRLGIVRILVRMMLLGELAVRRFDVLGRGALRHAQHLIGILHACPAGGD